MPPPVELVVEVRCTGVDVGCGACWWGIENVPTALVERLAAGHRDPYIARVHLEVDGQPQTWVRRA